MLKRPSLWNVTIILVAGLISCSPETNPVTPTGVGPQETGDGFLSIRTEKNTYPRPEGPYGRDFAATIVNQTDRLFYARLGDGFIASQDQATLMAAEGSDGFLEQWDSSEWQPLPRPVAIEGTAVIALRPRSTYTLNGYFPPARGGIGIPDPWAKVSLRFRVQYFDDPGMAPEQAHQDFSNTFVLTR